jgi:hypothetical protein
MLICGHTQASPEPHPTGLCNHFQTCTVHKNVTPTQLYAKLLQSACNNGCPTDPARAKALPASSPSACTSFIAGWPKRPQLSLKNGTKEKPFGDRYVTRFCWSRRAAAAPAAVATAERVLIDKGWITEMSAMVMPPGIG